MVLVKASWCEDYTAQECDFQSRSRGSCQLGRETQREMVVRANLPTRRVVWSGPLAQRQGAPGSSRRPLSSGARRLPPHTRMHALAWLGRRSCGAVAAIDESVRHGMAWHAASL